MTLKPTHLLQVFVLITTFQHILSIEDGYLRYVKDSCFLRGEALSCVKYKAVKIAKKAIFGDSLNSNETIKANQMISLVPLDNETIEKLGIKDNEVKVASEPRGFLSEWAELAKYFMKLFQEFFKVKGIKVNLPEGARTVEEEEDDGDNETNDADISLTKSVKKRDTAYLKSARGKKKKLALIIPFLTLLAVMKMKLLLIPILLSVLLLKKLALIAALLLPSLFSTLKACKHQHHPMSYSYFGSSDTSDYAADYNNNYAYSASGGYGKDWASNRAYNMMKHRSTPSPAYITAPGVLA
ncbi:uncharacterized protein LOC113498740 isoform X2 [Trichoplusia ni]|uniref:Uncharacterized protein LOC113498740 isoform X2 n=1 Tax=Trichoplusia ni TaxID=7111 RepID=A0A7E5W239_TRINI|nr:uncharacterized protein LOC113498740 isoform X2 [Trichoplusia ni]